MGDVTHIPVVVGVAGGALSVGMNFAQDVVDGSQTDGLLLQGGVVGVVLGVGMFLLRRSDNRETTRDASAAAELRAEREAHEQTRRELLRALRQLNQHHEGDKP